MSDSEPWSFSTNQLDSSVIIAPSASSSASTSTTASKSNISGVLVPHLELSLLFPVYILAPVSLPSSSSMEQTASRKALTSIPRSERKTITRTENKGDSMLEASPRLTRLQLRTLQQQLQDQQAASMRTSSSSLSASDEQSQQSMKDVKLKSALGEEIYLIPLVADPSTLPSVDSSLTPSDSNSNSTAQPKSLSLAALLSLDSPITQAHALANLKQPANQSSFQLPLSFFASESESNAAATASPSSNESNVSKNVSASTAVQQPQQSLTSPMKSAAPTASKQTFSTNSKSASNSKSTAASVSSSASVSPAKPKRVVVSLGVCDRTIQLSLVLFRAG